MKYYVHHIIKASEIPQTLESTPMFLISYLKNHLIQTPTWEQTVLLCSLQQVLWDVASEQTHKAEVGFQDTGSMGLKSCFTGSLQGPWHHLTQMADRGKDKMLKTWKQVALIQNWEGKALLSSEPCLYMTSLLVKMKRQGHNRLISRENWVTNPETVIYQYSDQVQGST